MEMLIERIPSELERESLEPIKLTMKNDEPTKEEEEIVLVKNNVEIGEAEEEDEAPKPVTVENIQINKLPAISKAKLVAKAGK
jgi:hypothetical protein